VCSGSYTVIGGLTSPDISQASTFTPRSMSSFFRRGLARLVPTLPSVRESPEYTLLSSSDDEGDDPKSSFRVKQEVVDGMDVGVPYTSDDTLLSDDDGSPPLSSPSDSFFVSETPSRTLGSDSVPVSDSPSLVTVKLQSPAIQILPPFIMMG
jgi:hypothetical protein